MFFIAVVEDKTNALAKVSEIAATETCCLIDDSDCIVVDVEVERRIIVVVDDVGEKEERSIDVGVGAVSDVVALGGVDVDGWRFVVGFVFEGEGERRKIECAEKCVQCLFVDALFISDCV